MRKNLYNFFAITMTLLLLVSVFPIEVFATEENKFYLGETVNTGKDTGYSKENKIDEDDPHFGWELGKFYVSGYTRATNTETECPIFLKNAGDTVTLWFSLKQDIKCLNGDDMLSLSDDSNGFDKYFEIKKTDFGKGTLVIRHTDYQNNKGAPQIYTDYLSANISKDADVKVKLFEEGDYEVALNYEIREDNLDIFGWNPFPTYHNYRIFFKFSVRNGNCMVFPFDIETKSELINTAITENGFYLDLAKSRYLDIDIKKEVMMEGAEGLVEDVRFNRPAKDGDKYTEEGIYTITVKNKYTEQETTKLIYVGTNSVLKAHVVTGLSIHDINSLINDGATINPDGTILVADKTIPSISTPTTENNGSSDDITENTDINTEQENNAIDKLIVPIVIGSILITAVIVFVIIYIKRKKKYENDTVIPDAEEEQSDELEEDI